MKVLSRHIVFLLFLVSALPALAAPIPVAVSIPPQKYFCEKIGGDLVAVTVMAASGADPHSYEPSASQMRRVAGARLYFAVGVPFEQAWLPRLTDLAPQAKLIRHDTGMVHPHSGRMAIENDNLNHYHGHDGHSHHAHAKPGHYHGDHGHKHAENGHEHRDHGHDHADHGHSHDPHIWVSPFTVARMAEEIRDALSEISPEHRERFAANTKAFQEEINGLVAEITPLFALLSPDERSFLSLHSAWGHYAAAFGLSELAVELEGKEPGPRSMARILATARDRNIRALVSEPGMGRNTVAALAESLQGVRLVEGNALEEDWSRFMRDFSRRLAEAMR